MESKEKRIIEIIFPISENNINICLKSNTFDNNSYTYDSGKDKIYEVNYGKYTTIENFVKDGFGNVNNQIYRIDSIRNINNEPILINEPAVIKDKEQELMEFVKKIQVLISEFNQKQFNDAKLSKE